MKFIRILHLSSCFCLLRDSSCKFNVHKITLPAKDMVLAESLCSDCVSKPFSIELHRKNRAEKSCLRKLRPDRVCRVMEVVQFHCPSAVVVGLKKRENRSGVSH